MPESSADKTTRKFISYLSHPQFNYRFSIFYNNYADRLKAIEHKPIITDALSRHLPSQIMLYKLGINKDVEKDYLDDLKDDVSAEDYFDMPFHTIFTDEVTEISALKDMLEHKLDCSLRLKRRAFTEVDKERYIGAMRRGELHDLLGYFPDLVNQRRWALLHKKLLSPS